METAHQYSDAEAAISQSSHVLNSGPLSEKLEVPLRRRDPVTV